MLLGQISDKNMPIELVPPALCEIDLPALGARGSEVCKRFDNLSLPWDNLAAWLYS